MVRDVDADVLVFQEVNDRWCEALLEIAGGYPYTVSRPPAQRIGIEVFSRFPIVHNEYVSVAGRVTLHMRLDVNGTPVSLLCTHPPHPLTPSGFRLRNDQLADATRAASERTTPLVLMGDLNTTMWSPWFRRLVADTGLENARHGWGILPSWPAMLPAFMRIPIDHCLVSDELKVAGCRLGPKIGSDHLPVIVDLVVPAFEQ